MNAQIVQTSQFVVSVTINGCQSGDEPTVVNACANAAARMPKATSAIPLRMTASLT
jgi:hypothetical protein